MRRRLCVMFIYTMPIFFLCRYHSYFLDLRLILSAVRSLSHLTGSERRVWVHVFYGK